MKQRVAAVISLEHGDCLDVLASWPPAIIDACVTDPPYHLTNNTGTRSPYPGQYTPIGRPKEPKGGFMGKQWDGGSIAFNPETWRAVFRVLKPGAHLLAMGSTRTYHRLVCAIEDAGFEVRDSIAYLYGTGFPKSHNLDGERKGWGTALKPAMELICLARKPLREKTVAANVITHGTGGINVDACRVGTTKEVPASPSAHRLMNGYGFGSERGGTSGHDPNLGRWPANVVHDGSPEVEAAFAAFGKSESTGGKGAASQRTALGGHIYGDYSHATLGQNAGGLGDIGTASRFFYTAKADRADRADSKHPTVKPVDLMRWLVRLITPPGGTVLDPFAGSGTTGEAAMLEGFDALLIERDATYATDIRHRIKRWSGLDAPLFAEPGAWRP